QSNTCAGSITTLKAVRATKGVDERMLQRPGPAFQCRSTRPVLGGLSAATTVVRWSRLQALPLASGWSITSSLAPAVAARRKAFGLGACAYTLKAFDGFSGCPSRLAMCHVLLPMSWNTPTGWGL